MGLLARLGNHEEIRYRDYILPVTLVFAVSIGASLLVNENYDNLVDMIPTREEVYEWITYQLYR